MTETTEILIHLIAVGNEPAFRRLYDRYHQKIYSIGYYFTQSQAVAEDITQDIFLKIWEKREELRTVEKFESWLKVLVRNHACNIITKMARERSYQAENIGEEKLPSVSRHLEQKERSQLILKAVQSLPEQQKKIYFLNKYDGFKAAEIAETLGLSVHTVKNHLKAATASVIAYCKKNVEFLLVINFFIK